MKECTNCGGQFNNAKTMTICNLCNTARVKSYSSEYKMLRRAKMRAKYSGRDFDLVLEDINIPQYCPVLGIELKCVEGSGGDDGSPSLDRIDSSKGYTKNNIQVISSLANKMKANASKEHMLKFANWVLGTFDTE